MGSKATARRGASGGGCGAAGDGLRRRRRQAEWRRSTTRPLRRYGHRQNDGYGGRNTTGFGVIDGGAHSEVDGHESEVGDALVRPERLRRSRATRGEDGDGGGDAELPGSRGSAGRTR